MKRASTVLIVLIGIAAGQTLLPPPESLQSGFGIATLDGDHQHQISSLAVQLGTPASSSAPCLPPTVLVDSNFVYACVAPDTWRRAALGVF